MSQDNEPGVPGYEDCVLCEHTGVKDGKDCPDCNGTGVTLPIVNRRGEEQSDEPDCSHNFIEGACTDCGQIEEQSDEPSLHNWVDQECTRCGQLNNAAASEICPAWKEGGRPGKMTVVSKDATNQLDAMEVKLDELLAGHARLLDAITEATVVAVKVGSKVDTVIRRLRST